MIPTSSLHGFNRRRLFSFKSIPSLQNQTAGAVFAVLLLFFFFEDAEGFAGEIGTIDILRIEDVTEFITGEAIKLGVISIKPVNRAPLWYLSFFIITL